MNKSGPARILLTCCAFFACTPDQGTRQGRSTQSLDLTLENIFGPRGRAGASEISPDGRYVAVSATGPQGSGIYLLPTATVQRSPPRRNTMPLLDGNQDGELPSTQSVPVVGSPGAATGPTRDRFRKGRRDGKTGPTMHRMSCQHYIM